MSVIFEVYDNEAIASLGDGDVAVHTSTPEHLAYPNEVTLIDAGVCGAVGEDCEMFNGIPSNEITRAKIRLIFATKESLQVVIDALEKVKSEWGKPQAYLYAGRPRKPRTYDKDTDKR